MLSAYASLGQAGLNPSGASNCSQADFDSTSNIASRPCVFDGPIYGPPLSGRVPDDPPSALCYDSENRLPEGQFAPNPPLTLKSGQVARQTFR